MTYKAGDPVWVLVKPNDPGVIEDGAIPGKYEAVVIHRITWHPDAYNLNIPALSQRERWGAEGRRIWPRKPPEEKREEIGEWELCPWRPKQDVAVS
jgi:hypothetical protein